MSSDVLYKSTERDRREPCWYRLRQKLEKRCAKGCHGGSIYTPDLTDGKCYDAPSIIER